MIGIDAIAGIITELLKLYSMIRGQYNDPKMVEAKVAQLHQDLRDHNERVEAVLQKPDATPQEKKAALDAIRLIDS